MRILKLTILTFISLCTLAKIDCNHKKSSLIESEFYLKPISMQGKVDCTLVQQIHDLSTKVSNTFDIHPYVSLFLEQRAFDASFDQAKIIKIPQHFFRKNSEQQYHIQSGENILPIFVHEYGHAIFTELLREEFPEYDEISSKVQLISDILITIKELQEEIKSPTIVATHRKELQDEIYRKSVILQKHKKELGKNTTAQRLKEIIIPYHELFADIVAVYFYEDKSIIKHAVDHPEYNQSEQVVPNRRSFDNHLSHSELSEDDVHGYYAPVRKLIGQNYWPKNLEEKEVYLRKIFQGISNDLRRKISLAKKESYKDSIKNLKTSIIKEFE